MYEELRKDRYDVWERFDAMYGFYPSVDPKDFPGIKEPTPSVTFTWQANKYFSWLESECYEEMMNELDSILMSAFSHLSLDNQISYILDWNHTCYNVIELDIQSYPVRVFPDGDYHIWLSKDLKTGTFGHPWEETLCIMGEELIDLAEPKLAKLLGQPNRSKK